MNSGILFATPCYGGMVFAPHFKSAMNLKDELNRQGVEHDWLIGWNESLVHRARMEMTATFLTTSFASMMWLDADIDYVPEDVAKLDNMDADIAVGVYAMKKRDEQWYAAWKDGALVKNLDQFSGPIEVDFAGTGFMLIKRHVIEALAREIESYDGQNGEVPALYMTPIINRCLRSEDYFFCEIARKAGFKVVMDPSVRLGHWGIYRYGA
jgi:hypothetical protein